MDGSVNRSELSDGKMLELQVFPKESNNGGYDVFGSVMNFEIGIENVGNDIVSSIMPVTTGATGTTMGFGMGMPILHALTKNMTQPIFDGTPEIGQVFDGSFKNT